MCVSRVARLLRQRWRGTVCGGVCLTACVWSVAACASQSVRAAECDPSIGLFWARILCRGNSFVCGLCERIAFHEGFGGTFGSRRTRLFPFVVRSAAGADGDQYVPEHEHLSRWSRAEPRHGPPLHWLARRRRDSAAAVAGGRGQARRVRCRCWGCVHRSGGAEPEGPPSSAGDRRPRLVLPSAEDARRSFALGVATESGWCHS